MPTNRTTTLPATWAAGAAAPPAEPIAGVTYADDALAPSTIEEGWPFSEIINSANFNEVMRRLTDLVRQVEAWGIMPWSPLLAYTAGARVMGSTGATYKAKINTTGHDPISSSTQWDLDDTALHAALTNPHGSTSSPTANTLMLRSANGRCQVASPAVAADIARLDNVTSHATLNNPHNATSAATGSRLMLRDASGRAKVAAPAATDDIARLDTITTHSSLQGTTGFHGVFVGWVNVVGAAIDSVLLPAGFTCVRLSQGQYQVNHNKNTTAASAHVSFRDLTSPSAHAMNAINVFDATANSFVVDIRGARYGSWLVDLLDVSFNFVVVVP